MSVSAAVSRALEPLESWIASLSPTLRPAALGGIGMLVMLVARGGFIVAPVLIVYALVASPTPATSIALGAIFVLLAMAGGGLGGLAYGVIGRHVQRAFIGGWYLTGIITSAPFAFALVYMMRIMHNQPAWVPLTRVDVDTFVSTTILLGLIIGHIWFAPKKARDLNISLWLAWLIAGAFAAFWVGALAMSNRANALRWGEFSAAIWALAVVITWAIVRLRRRSNSAR